MGKRTKLLFCNIPFKNINHETVYLPKGRVIEKRDSFSHDYISNQFKWTCFRGAGQDPFGNVIGLQGTYEQIV